MHDQQPEQPHGKAPREGKLDTTRPFTRGDAVAAGITPRMLAGSRFRRIFRDVHISTKVKESREELILGALLLHPETAFASHTTAAEHYGVVVPASASTHISVFADKDRRWAVGIKPHVAPKHTKVVVHRGIRVSNRIRMFIELAAVLELVDLVVAGDNMLKVFGMNAEELRSELAKSRDYWSGAARYAAQFVRDEVDSPMETRLRMLLVLAGLPEPEVNIKVRNDLGDVVMRFDMGYRDRRVAVEYEGRQHVAVIERWEDDIHRDEAVDEMAWKKLKVTSRGIDPATTVYRVWKALCARGQLVPRPTDAWRVHFPGRPLAG
jgi:very-short-patch-repair endonuclease